MKTMVNGKEIKVWDKNAISAVLTSEVKKDKQGISKVLVI